MSKSPSRGILLAVEGIDGAGKTTQVRRLSEALGDAGERVIVSKEPTDGPWGKIIRQSAQNGRLPLDEELHAFVQDRKEHIQTLIEPGLSAGATVILDRYYYSTIAYQGSRGADPRELDELMREFAPVPDMVFLLDLDPAIALTRISLSRGDIPNSFERMDTLTAVRAVFNQLADFDDRVWKLDGTLSVDRIHDTISSLLIDNALKAARCAKAYGCDDIHHCGPRLTNECRWFDIARALGGVSVDYPALISRPSV